MKLFDWFFMGQKHDFNVTEFFISGFNPRWDCTFNFTVHVPELALVRFVVEDHDYTSSNNFLGQYTLPVASLRTGESGLQDANSV